jgi:hypothetical protein
MNLASWFWRKSLKMFSAFSLLGYHVPLEKGYSIRLKKFESPPRKNDLCQVWLKLGQCSGEEDF